MKRTLLVLGITLLAAPAQADLTHRLSSSVQLDVGGASSRAVRVGNSYSISGNGIDVFGDLLALPLAMQLAGLVPQQTA